jgi:hypothetical protein
MTREQEIAVWKQALWEQRERADSLFRAWLTTVVVLLLTNLYWIVRLWK